MWFVLDKISLTVMCAVFLFFACDQNRGTSKILHIEK